MPRSTQPKRGRTEPALNRLLSVAEVSEIISVSPKLIRDWISAGLLPAFRLGPNTRLMRVRSQDLEAFIEQHIRKDDVRKPNGQS